jgi:hypothetical protein
MGGGALVWLGLSSRRTQQGHLDSEHHLWGVCGFRVMGAACGRICIGVLFEYRMHIAERAFRFWAEIRRHGRVLVYCRQGANRSIAWVLLSICLATGRS